MSPHRGAAWLNAREFVQPAKSRPQEGCHGKIAYASHAEALAAIRRVGRRGGFDRGRDRHHDTGPAAPYRCLTCLQFHLGRTDKPSY